MALFDIIEGLFRRVGGTDSDDYQLEQAADGRNYSRNYDVDFERIAETIDTPTGEKEWGLIGSDGDYYGGNFQRSIFEKHRYDEDDEEPLFIGVNRKRSGQNYPVPIEYDDLFRHVSMFGATGFGKSTMLKNLMVQLAFKGKGFCYIDPKGDDVKELLQLLPPERLDDVIWMEPAADDHYESIIGFNFLSVSADPGDPNYDSEVNERIDDLKAIIASRNELYARMERVVEALAAAMIRSEQVYTILDLYFMMRDEETRKQFVKSIKDEGLNQYVIECNKALTQLRDEDLEPLKGRIQPWVLNPETREIIGQEENSVEVEEMVDDQKILLVDNSNVRQELKEMMATVVVRQIWGHVQKRADIPEDERTDYFLVVDEFDDVVNKKMEIDRILSKARSLRLSFTMANQNPEQLDQSLQRQIFSNTDTLLGLNVGDPGQAKVITKQFQNVDVSDYLNLKQFETLTQVKIDGDPSPPMKTTNFPDYPPLRSKQEAEQVKLKSLERYGGERRSDDDDMKLHIDGITDPSVDGEADGEPLLDAVVDATYIATTYESHQQDTSVEYVDPDRIEQVLEALGREVDNIHQFMENNGNIFGTQILVGDATRFGLKEKGKAMSQQLDSGSSGSAGKTNHRAMLKEARDELAKLGIAMTIPSQGGDEEEPDGIGHPFAVDEKAPAGELMHDTDNSTVLIEAESTTSTSRPAQMLNNLRKAYDQDEKCVFLVRNGKNNRPFEWGATNIATKISDEPLLASKQRDGEAKYYNLQRGAPPHLHKPTSKKDKGIVLRPKLDSERRPESRWWKTADGRIVLRDGEGTVNAEFASIRAFENWELDDFPAHFVETVDGSYSVTVDGSFHEEYDSISALKDDWVRIREPYVPEIEFDGDLPTTDDYSVIILPDDSVESPPQLYAGAEQYHSLYSYESEPADPEQAAVEGLTENDGEPTESDEDTEEPGRNRFV